MQRPAPRVLHGDATDGGAWERLLAGERAGALVTDPPYCLLTRRRKSGAPRDPKGRKLDVGPVRRFEDVAEYRGFTRAWLALAARHLADDAPMVVWSNPLGAPVIRACAAELGWSHLRGEFIWGKRTRDGNSGETILRVVETAWVFARAGAGAAPPDAPATPWAAVSAYDPGGEGARWGGHPNHKPFEVLEPLLRTWTRPGMLVCDPFAGSGAIGAAAVRLERRIAAMDLDATWAGAAAARLDDLARPAEAR